MKIENSVKVGLPSDFTNEEKNLIVELLKQQGKVIRPSVDKLNACQFIATVKENDVIISIGAIKPKTVSDFTKAKANLETDQTNFDWELGYCYTHPDHTRKGHSSSIVQSLLSKVDDTNLIASTEIVGSSMKGILERHGFKQKGKTWKSKIHGGELGLFLKEQP